MNSDTSRTAARSFRRRSSASKATAEYGGPFNAYYEALADLGSDFVRFAPWFANPRVVVNELYPSDCTAAKPATNWNSTLFDGVMRDFMAAGAGFRPSSVRIHH